MSREEVCRELLRKIAEEADGLTANEVIALCLEDIAVSLAQIADKIGCDYEKRKEFVADNATKASLVTVYHRRERE